MPTYEYACRECGEHLEVVQSFKDDPLTTCGACGGNLRKVFSAAGIIFKGSGYYVTDSRRAAGGSDAKESSTSDSGSKESTDKESKAKESKATETKVPDATAKTAPKSGDSAAKSA